MSYDTGQRALAGIIQNVTAVNGLEVREYSWQHLSQGKAPVCVNLHRGAAVATLGSVGVSAHTRDTVWETIVEIWVRLRSYPESAIALDGALQEIRNAIDAAITLEGAALEAYVSRIDEPMEIPTVKDGPPIWLRQVLVVTWAEEDSITHS